MLLNQPGGLQQALHPRAGARYPYPSRYPSVLEQIDRSVASWSRQTPSTLSRVFSAWPVDVMPSPPAPIHTCCSWYPVCQSTQILRPFSSGCSPSMIRSTPCLSAAISGPTATPSRGSVTTLVCANVSLSLTRIPRNVGRPAQDGLIGWMGDQPCRPPVHMWLAKR